MEVQWSLYLIDYGQIQASRFDEHLYARFYISICVNWIGIQEVDSRPMVSLDMRGLNKVLWVNAEDGVAMIEAGITGMHLKYLGFHLGLLSPSFCAALTIN